MDSRFLVDFLSDASLSSDQATSDADLATTDADLELDANDETVYYSADELDTNEANLGLPGPVIDYSALPSSSLDLSKTGVIYLSKIPPFMKPTKLRHLLSQYGEIGRIYLTPEDTRTALRRRKYKGNKRQNFTEGWVEWHSKAVAKKVAESLNAQMIGGKKRAYYHDDIWAMRYLPRFKWAQLTEQIAYERAVKEQRMRTEMSQAKKNTREYMKNVEKGKMIDSMQARKAAKNLLAGIVEAPKTDAKAPRMIRQRKSVVSEVRNKVDTQQASTLSRIFS